MDFCEEERYAAAALFTLALHSTQIDAGAGRLAVRDKLSSAWGEPSTQVLDRFLEGRVAKPELSGPAWDAFWGWDCCGPHGLLDRVYQQLELPQRTWAGLKKLPEVAYGDSFDEFMELVKTYMAVLDTTLPMPLRKKRRKKKRSNPLLSSNGVQSIDALLFGGSGGASRAGGGSVRRGSDYRISGSSGHLIFRGKVDVASSAFQPAMPIHKELADEYDGAEQEEREERIDLFEGLIEDAGSGSDSDLEADLQRDALRRQLAQESEDALRSEGMQPSVSSASLLSCDSDGSAGARPLTPLLEDSVLGDEEAAVGCSGPLQVVRVQLYVKRVDDLFGDALEMVCCEMKVLAVAAGARGAEEGESAWSPSSSVCTEAPDVRSVRPADPEPSQKALAAIWELLEGCLALAHPELQEQVQEQQLEALERRLSVATAEAHVQVGGDHPAAHKQQGGGARADGGAASAATGSPAHQRQSSGAPPPTADQGAGEASLPREGALTRHASSGELISLEPVCDDAASGSHPLAPGTMGRLGLEPPLQRPATADAAGEEGGTHGQEQLDVRLLPIDGERSDAAASSSVAVGGGVADGDAELAEKLMHCVPRARWYDARMRVALKRLVHWLNVPWSRAQNFEALLAYQLQCGERKRPKLEIDMTTKSKRWARVATYALAGGSAFALVGGLVMAPAFAFALPLAGGFFASTSGVAAMASGMAALGMVDAGARASRMTQLDVKEFGFMEVKYEHEAREDRDAGKRGAADNADGAGNGASEQRRDAEAAEGSTGSGEGEAAPERHGGLAAPAAAGEDGGGPSGSAAALAGAAAAACNGSGGGAAHEAGQLDPGHLMLAGGGGGGPRRLSRPGPGDVSRSELSSGKMETARLVTGPSSSGSVGGSARRSWFSRRSYSNVGTSASAEDLGSCSSGDKGGGGDKGSGGDKGGAGGGDDEASNEKQQLSKWEARKTAKAEAKKAQEADMAWWQRKKEEALLDMPLSPSRSASGDARMGVVIGVNGWIAKREEFLTMWKHLKAPDSDVFSLIWESKDLIALNYALTSFFTTQVAQQLAQQLAAKSVLGPFVPAVVPAIMLNTASSLLIDNAWNVMTERSQKAGKLLAHTLMTGGHGDRPVTLIGYSMGARLVFHCLLELCRHNCKGIVEHVVLLGTPVGVRAERWRMARSVVAGRFVNGFSRNDWVLQVVYRTSKGFTRAAGGLGPVNLPGIENVNLTGLIEGHFSYIFKVDEIMELVNLWPT